MSLENVKYFYAKLASDEAFRTQIQGVNTKAECSQIVKGAGFDFTLEEYEQYTAQLLESSFDNGEMKDLNEKELEAVFGGVSSIIGKPIIQPLYGGIRPWPWQPIAQPMYGIVVPLDTTLES